MNSKILLLKCDLQINAVNYLKHQRRPSSRLATVMFRGTPCIKVSFLFVTNIFSSMITNENILRCSSVECQKYDEL